MSNLDQSKDGGASSANTTSSMEGSSRWWQYYLVRYAPGTAVGAVIFCFLCLRSIALRSLFFDTTATIRLDGAHLTLLAANGLAYCYVASSPLLVFHAGRFLLTLSNDVASLSRFARRSSIIIAVLTIFVWLVWGWYSKLPRFALGESILCLLALFLV
jgi:hypothetical protein